MNTTHVVHITEDPLLIEDVYAQLGHPESGAAVVFVGRVRNYNEGHDVSHIHYTAYRDMALSETRRILEAAKFSILKAVVVHRLGKLAVGEVSIVVGVATAHRKDAFAACQWVMDAVKQSVPIWKQEFVKGTHRWPINMPSS